MKDGFVRVAAATCELALANPSVNAERLVRVLREAEDKGVKLLCFPELCLTGYTAGDLFLQPVLREQAIEALMQLAGETAGLSVTAVVGLPLVVGGRLYNCAAVVGGGRVLGIVPKRNPPNYGEFYELRHFAPGPRSVSDIELNGQSVPFGCNMLFCCAEMPSFVFAVEICEDLWVPRSPGADHAVAGATLIVNPSASDETVGKAKYRELLVRSASARLMAGYVYADAGDGESTSDLVFSGHNLIAENGTILSASTPYENGLTMTELDLDYLMNERLRMNTFPADEANYRRVAFHTPLVKTEITRKVDPAPFIPGEPGERRRRMEEILSIQVQGLSSRLKHIGVKKLVVGVSGGLDSTLALIVSARALQKLRLPAKNLTAVTMPCFGTTDRTYQNALKLSKGFGAELVEVNIRESVKLHFANIGQDENVHDVTYENSQARERTQVLMDMANKSGALVVGTGDLSELALGWATYNGDHMSMYGVNASIPKTLVRYLVAHAAEEAEGVLREALLDVLDTPVSPELLPPVAGQISQRTEDLVGPYELHDFFLYHMLRRMSPPRKVFRLAKIAFAGRFDEETIEKWLSTFIRRFFSQQFKRNCLPDGPKVGSVSLSPRGDWRMPSDVSGALWQNNLGHRA